MVVVHDLQTSIHQKPFIEIFFCSLLSNPANKCKTVRGTDSNGQFKGWSNDGHDA